MMPGIWPLNNVATQNGYVDAVTAQFPIGRNAFSLQVYNAAILYKLITWEPPNNFQLDATEHFLSAVLARFDDPVKEGLAAGVLFGGIAIRSAVAGMTANVTVI